MELHLLKDDNDHIWLLDISGVAYAPPLPTQLRSRVAVAFKVSGFTQCPGAYCRVEPRKQLAERSEDDEVFQYYDRFGDYMLGWINVVSSPSSRS